MQFELPKRPQFTEAAPFDIAAGLCRNVASLEERAISLIVQRYPEIAVHPGKCIHTMRQGLMGEHRITCNGESVAVFSIEEDTGRFALKGPEFLVSDEKLHRLLNRTDGKNSGTVWVDELEDFLAMVEDDG